MIWTLQYMNYTQENCFLLAYVIDHRPQKVSPTSRHPTVTKYRQHGGDSNGLCHRRMFRRIVGARSLVLILRHLSCQQRVLMYMLVFGASPGDFVGYRVNDRLRSGWFSTLRSPLICNFGRLLRFSTSNGYQCRYVSSVFSRVSASVWCVALVVLLSRCSRWVSSWCIASTCNGDSDRLWCTWTSWLLLRTVICWILWAHDCWNFWNCYGCYLCMCYCWQLRDDWT